MRLKEIETSHKTHTTMKAISKAKMWFKPVVLLLFGMAMMVFSCKKDTVDVLFTGDEYQNILQYIDNNQESYSFFREIIEVGRLADALGSYNSHLGGNGYTLFLPDNDAVNRFINENSTYGSLDELLEDTLFTKELIRYHVLNVEVNAFDFANGALPDKTLSEDFLTVIFLDEGGEIVYSVNNEAKVDEINIQKSNGIIHLIDKMLTPVVYTGYQWTQVNRDQGYGIYSELLKICGLEDTLNYYFLDELNRKIYDEYTLFVESDELYQANGINNIDDLIAEIGPEDSNYSHPDNRVNKFARYHVLSSSVFLDEFETAIYNTYGDLPVSVDYGLDIKFNTGTQLFDTVISGVDTLLIDYLMVDQDHSNILTKTGAIHQLDQILFPFLPGRKTKEYQFYEEYQINELRYTEGSTDIRKEDLDVIELFGIDYLNYTNQASNIPGVSNNDYISMNGNFEFTYHMPQILAGAYEVSIVAHRNDRSNAVLQAYLDGNKLGSVLDLTSGSNANSDFSPAFVLGTIEFAEYSRHEIQLKTLVPGRLWLDRIEFIPVSN
jgi:uncharacterized surface protein with fasciclin (FAS1) repeats